MDEKPFLVLQISDLDETLIPELQKLTKDTFDIESIVSAAEELKYIGEIKRVLAAQFTNPDTEWVRSLTGRVYEGSITQKVRDQFKVLVTKASKQFLSDQVNDRIKAALGGPGYRCRGMTHPCQARTPASTSRKLALATRTPATGS